MGCVLFGILLMRMTCVQFTVEGMSMAPALSSGDGLVVMNWHYRLVDPAVGDVVVFHAPAGYGQRQYVKRIVAVPGDVVLWHAGRLIVNNIPLDEPYLATTCNAGQCRDSIWVLAEEEYFVLGDNRNQSQDSRAFGYIKRSMIIGQAIMRFWPPHHMSWIH